jgi:SAM-dependent methyltransferase
MLAPVQLPEEFAVWNRTHGAPAGYERPRRSLFRRFYSDESWLRLSGPFAIQPGNNSTRRFEYPWAFHAADLSQPRTIVELGGSLAGLQFVLARAGHHVINVDPGLEASGLGWDVTPENIARLNDWFSTDVRLINTTLDQAGLADESVDVMFSISVLEHLTHQELTEVMRHARRVLRREGRFVITLDLFLNLAPFTARDRNEYGTNQSVCQMVEESGLEITTGKRAELFGFPEFDATTIQAQCERYMIGSYPVLTQCMVLRKP